MAAVGSTPNNNVVSSASPNASDVAQLLGKLTAPGVTQLDSAKLLAELQTMAAKMNTAGAAAPGQHGACQSLTAPARK